MARRAFTARQRAQIARAVEAARAARAKEIRQVKRGREQAESELAERLLPHVCEDSVVDRGEHALGVARMILQSGKR